MRHLIVFSFILAFALSAHQIRSQETRPSAQATSATTRPTPAPEEEPATSTAPDSLAVNLDEASTKVINADDDTSTEAGDSLEGVAGIEPKSISSADGDNRVASAEDAKLTADETSSAPEETGDESAPEWEPKPSKGTQAQRLNMSQIEQLYQWAHKDEQETARAWRRMGRKLKKGIGSVIGSMVPMALNMSQEAKISSNCSGAMLKWVLSMNQLKSWALRMLDAAGKPVAGILEGSLTMFGNYRQCLKIRAPDDDEIEFAGEFREYFRGKYCVIQAKPWLPEKSRFYNLNTKLKSLTENTNEEENAWYDKTVFDELNEWALAFNFVNIRMDLCVPSLCTREDIQKATNFLLRGIDLKAQVLRCEMDTPSGHSSIESGGGEVGEAFAATLDTQKTFSELFSQLGWLLVPITSVALVVLASALSLAIDERDQASGLRHTIRSLSLRRSLGSHLNVDYEQLADDKPLALYGIRFLLVLWVILVESAVNLKFEYLRELLMLKDLIFWWPMQVVINSTLQFDSIILLGAFTMAYKNFLNDGVHGAKAISRFVIDKYVRLMPSVMLAVAFTILLPLAYRGPVWTDYVTKQSAVCQSTGWLNMLFLQNYLPYKEICLPHTWLLCVEFQLVLLAAPVLYYLNKSYAEGAKQAELSGRQSNQKEAPGERLELWQRPLFWLRTAPGLLLLLAMLAAFATSFYNVWAHALPPSWLYTMADPDSKAIYFGAHLTKLWTHLAVFAIGLLAGLECRRASRNALLQLGFRHANLELMGRLGEQSKSQLSSASSLPAISRADSSLLLSSSARSTSGALNASSVTVHLGPHSPAALSGAGHAHPRSCWLEARDLFACLLAAATMLAILFSTHQWSLAELPEPLVAGAYDVSSRLAWSLALAWLLRSVSVPVGGQLSLAARALGHPLLVALGRLSFLVYLLHPLVHTSVLAIQEQPVYSSWLMLFHVLVGNLTLSVGLAALSSLFVELPCRNLFRRAGSSLLLTQVSAGSGSGSGAKA